MQYDIYKGNLKCFNCGKTNLFLVGRASNNSVHKVKCYNCNYNIGDYDWEEWLKFIQHFNLELI